MDFSVKPSRLVVLSQADMAAAKHFADLRTQDSYPDTGQTQHLNLYRQILVGALVELAAYRHLPHCPPPDLNYYPPKDKSWRLDFTYGEYALSCKGQWVSAAKRYGMSWTYQYNSNVGRRDSGLDAPEGLQIFGIVKDEDPRYVAIKAIVFSKDIIPSHLDLPQVEHLQKYKRCIYYSRLDESIKKGVVRDLKFLHTP